MAERLGRAPRAALTTEGEGTSFPIGSARKTRVRSGAAVAPERRSSVARHARFVDHALVAAPVHLDQQRIVEAQVAHEAQLAAGALAGQPVPVDEALSRVRVHGEVAD